MSVVVVVHNMGREAPRTLFSLSAGYQRDVSADSYEVIVVDNGSDPPLDPRMVEDLPGQFRLIRLNETTASPAKAANLGIASARGDIIGLMIDGARLVTPGLVHFARRGAGLYDTAIVATLGWYLGYDYQSWSMQAGYDSAREDKLLESIDWKTNGYRLFEISVLDESSVEGWFQPISESNALFLRRQTWETLGGLDERFDAPGGGLLNLDTFRRALELPEAELVILLSEATFHQLHGGVSTNSAVNAKADNWLRWASQYETIRKQPFQVIRPRQPPTFLGRLPRPALLQFTRAATEPFPRLDPASAFSSPLEPPLGFAFDKNLWALERPQPPPESQVQELTGLMHNEFLNGEYAAAAAIARLIRETRPEEPEPQRVLSLVVPYSNEPSSPAIELALGKAAQILDQKDKATTHYQAALRSNPNLAGAHIGLAEIRMPGDFYHVWLDRLYRVITPDNVVEIGIDKGQSLSRVRPPTIAIGVDPRPNVSFPMTAQTHIFPETSDEFFRRRRLDALLPKRSLGIGFIDGLHLYEQALADFINLETYAGPQSVILIHDTVPLDEATQDRSRNTQFHTGDVWKVVLCLKHYRPDLHILTIATPWTGLTVVIGLDAKSRVLTDAYDEAVEKFLRKSFSEIEHNLEDELNIVPNEWDAVRPFLEEHGIVLTREEEQCAVQANVRPCQR